MANKLRCFIRNNAVNFTLFLVFSVFICLKVANLDNYYFYDGKITGFYKVASKYYTAGRSSRVVIRREIPEIEYYKNKDTIRCDQGDLRLVTNFKLNEKITVLVDEENNNKTMIYSLFYYWIDYNELIILLFSFLIILGFIHNFV